MTIIIFLTTGKQNSTSTCSPSSPVSQGVSRNGNGEPTAETVANPVTLSKRIIIPITVLYKNKPLKQPHQNADASEIQELTADCLEAIRTIVSIAESFNKDESIAAVSDYSTSSSQTCALMTTRKKTLVARKYKKRSPALSSRSSCSSCRSFVASTSRSFNASNVVVCFTCQRKANEVKLLKKKLRTSKQREVRLTGYLKVYTIFYFLFSYCIVLFDFLLQEALETVADLRSDVERLKATDLESSIQHLDPIIIIFHFRLYPK